VSQIFIIDDQLIILYFITSSVDTVCHCPISMVAIVNIIAINNFYV
jgi:hypothetical protein